MSKPYSVFVGQREETAHATRECASVTPITEMTPQEAREEGYTACLECLPEGWPDE